MCPPHGLLAKLSTLVLASLFVWGVCWSLTRHEALPGGNFFALIVLVIACVIGGDIVEKLGLPPLLGKSAPQGR